MGRCSIRAAVFLTLPLLLVSLSRTASAAVSVGEAIGTVQIRKAGGSSWGSLGGPGHVVSPGDEIRTGRASRAILVFDDGSKIEIGANGSFTLEEAKEDSASMKFNLGFMKAWVTKALARKFSVRTPTAVCSVRGTEFGVNVADNGNTNVQVFDGLVGVADQQGNEVLLAQGERVDVGAGGIGQKSDASSEGTDDRARQALKREVGLDMTKEEIQAAAAIEQKNAVYQQGKALIDVNGNRVRVEEYIIRPTDNSFKLVVLNERANRFDYFYYTGNFNKTLPSDLSVALRQIPGQAITAPEYFLTSYETGRSNTQDSVLENASGGHLVDVNNNGVAGDDVTLAFDSRVDGLVRLSVPNPGGAAGNDPYFTTLYQNYSLAFNKVNHTSWVPAAGAPAYNPITFTGGITNYTTHITRTDVVNLVQPPNCIDGDHCTYFPDPNKFQQNIYRENATGTIWDKFENYIISDEGKIANTSDFAGASSGGAFKSLLLNWNYQQIITASEFQGRKIDLVVAPKILIESGLIP